MSKYKKGIIVEGIVTSIKKYGAFLSFDEGYIGLLHISEISNVFVTNIFNYFRIGDKINVVVKEIDEDGKRISVSLKDVPSSMNPTLEKIDGKPIVQYVKDIDFSKLDKALPLMIKKELERDAK